MVKYREIFQVYNDNSMQFLYSCLGECGGSGASLYPWFTAPGSHLWVLQSTPTNTGTYGYLA